MLSEAQARSPVGPYGFLREAAAAALCRHLVSVGAWRRRRDIRAFLRLELWARGRRMGRFACRRGDHGVHVSLPRLLHRGDECGSSRCGRHLRLRATRDGPMGRLPVRRLRQRRVCADPCGHLLLHRVLSRQHVRYRLAGLVLVDRDLWPVSRAEHPRHRALVSRHPCHHAHIARDFSAVLRSCRSAYRHRPLGIEHRR